MSADLGALETLEAELAELLAEEDVEHLAAAMDPGSVAGVLVYENLWAAPFASAARAARVVSSSPTAESLFKPSRPQSKRTRLSRQQEADMPLRPGRIGRVGVVGAPVAKAAVVTRAVTPGPSPVAKAAVVTAAVTPRRRRRI